MMSKEVESKTYARLLNDDFYGLNLKNNIKFLKTDYLLRCVEGVYDSKQIRLSELGNSIVIGSDSSKCNFTFKDQDMSPEHCKLTYIPDSIYYSIEDLGSASGTWKKLSFFEDFLEIKETTEFRIYLNVLIFEKVEEGFVLKFTEGSLAGNRRVIDEDFFEIGKRDCFYEITMPCSENHIMRVQKVSNRLFVSYLTSDVTNEGFFYRLIPNKPVLLRAEDCIKIGSNTFRVLNHNWGVTSEIGDKHIQEDTFTIIDDMRLFDDVVVSFYAIFDGHGGPACSYYLKNYFHKNLKYIIKMRNIRDSESFFLDFVKAAQEAFVYTDLQFLDKEKICGLHQGSTCIALFFIGNKIISCNLGDSLSILIRNGKPIYLSRDLKPDREKERDRIIKKNGFISNDGRILSLISVSRAFGDWKLKDPKKADSIRRTFQNESIDIEEYLMGNRAEFRIFEINQLEDEYVILASDGIFQHHQPQCIFDYISKHYKQEKVDTTKIKSIPSVVDNVRVEIINNLYRDGTSEKKNVDNMSLILVHLQNDKL